MGNAQSTEGPRKTAQRLSKPKTGNHAAAGLLSPGVFSNRSRRLSNAQLPDPPAPSSTEIASTPTTSSASEVAGGFGPRIDSIASLPQAPASHEEPKRRSLFRSRSTRGVASVHQNQSGGPGSRLVDRMARTRSMTYESAVGYYGPPDLETRLTRSDSCTSVNYNLTSYEAKRLLNLAEDPQLESAAAMSDNMMTAVTETTWKSSNPARMPNSPITRTNSDVSLYMPVRRRSMIQTPGVATRSASNRDLPPLPRVSVRHSLPPTPSLSRKQSVESYRSSIMPMPSWIAESDSAPRVATPCEDKYLSIGAFKLGSLRITNGFPSPATPDLEKASRNDGPDGGCDLTQEGYFQESQNSKTGDTGDERSRADTDSPELRLPEISQNPSSGPNQKQPASPALQTISKVTALDDHLFDDDAQPEYSSIEVLDVRPDPNAKPPHPGVTKTDSGFASTASPSSEVCHKSLAKADSGYSSNVSLRSFQSKNQGSRNQSNAASPEEQPSRSSSQEGEVRVGPTSQESPDRLDVRLSLAPESEPPPPPVPPKDAARYSLPPRSKLGNATAKSAPNHSSIGETRMSMPNAVKHLPETTFSRSFGSEGPTWPLPEPRSPESVGSSVSGNLSSPRSIGGGNSKPGRLQRLLGGTRRATMSTPVSLPLHDFEQSSIPPVPQEAEQKLRGRSSRINLTSKKAMPRSRPSLDTLKTIFSVGSLEASLDAVNTMQSTPTAINSGSGEGAWKQGLQSVPASIANVAAYVIPKRARARKPVPIPQEKASESSQAVKDRYKDGSHDDMIQANADAPVARSESSRRTTSFRLEDGQATTPRYRVFDMNLAHSTPDVPSPALPSPVAKALAAESYGKTPEPTHSIRRPPSLRVPPSLSRKTSRESIQSYPAAHPLARQSSMNSINSYQSSQASAGYGSAHSRSHSLVSMDPRRLQSFRRYSPETSPYASPTWEVRSDTARWTPQPFTGSESRRNSISSVQSEGIYRSADVQGWHIRTPQQQLRHRTSFDGYGYRHRFPQRGYPPSMSNGYTAAPKPANDYRSRGQLDAAAIWTRSQFDAAAGQWYQDQNLPYVPRGHYRSRSIGQGPNPPYRVLHSYNSPAYRHAPIWG
ncbi:hypothetical protein C7999DRAFT_30674 [Corynascus novoguineensis]|uniref:Proteophosphoglycan ppg4 n=1 Tax=Corynascus novoguineensis TaxID=1126955 RepID=A0AAN7CUY2_9PEZI|nr:hypothetical protein C7999DRAFT_30674 [Corynascus novoguineensis]